MKKCFSFLLALTLMLAVCAAASAETITLKIAHNYDFVTIPNSVIAAADRLNERYAAEGKDIKIEFEKDYQRIDWGEYGQNLIFAYKNGDCPDIFSVSDVPTMAAVGMLLDLSDLNQDAFVDGAFNSFSVNTEKVPQAMEMRLQIAENLSKEILISGMVGDSFVRVTVPENHDTFEQYKAISRSEKPLVYLTMTGVYNIFDTESGVNIALEK